jgi:DNA repair exonuclease SbcCD ATPase subunit
MSDDDSRTFTLGSLEERTPLPAATPAEAQRGLQQIATVNRRITRVALLLLTLMLALGSAGYWEFRQQMRQRQDVEMREVTALAQVLRSDMDALTQRLEAIESGLAEGRQKTEKEIILLRKETDDLQKRLQSIDVSGAVQKQQAALLAQVTASQEPLQKELKALTSRTTALDARVNEIGGVSSAGAEKTATEVAQLKKRLEQLDGQMVGKDQLNLEMLKVRKAYETQLATERRELEKQIRSALEQLARLESRLGRGATPGATTVPGTPPRTGAPIREQPLP